MEIRNYGYLTLVSVGEALVRWIMFWKLSFFIGQLLWKAEKEMHGEHETSCYEWERRNNGKELRFFSLMKWPFFISSFHGGGKEGIAIASSRTDFIEDIKKQNTRSKKCKSVTSKKPFALSFSVSSTWRRYWNRRMLNHAKIMTGWKLETSDVKSR